MATQADDIQRIVEILRTDHVTEGKAARLRARAWPGSWGKEGLGHLAKAAGATPEAVAAWEAGQAVPTTQQTLAWLSELHRRQPRSMGDPRAVGDLEGAGPARPPYKPVPVDPQAIVAGDGGKRREFAPDLSAFDARDTARFLAETAARAGYNPTMPKMLRNPAVSLLRLLAVSAEGGRAPKVAHALAAPRISAVHGVLDAAIRRLESDSPYGDIAVRLLREWETHVKWKPADERRRRPAGPADDSGEGPARGH